jgi:hypothetical protein
MIKLKSLLKESLLTELEFGTQDAFDDYQKNHDMRADTQVTVAGKKMSVGQAAKQSKDPAVNKIKGTAVFGKKKNYAVTFGDADSDAARSIYDKEIDKAKKAGRDFSKDPFPDFGSDAWKTMHSNMRRNAAEKNPGYQKIKGMADKFKSMGYEESEVGYGDYGSALVGKSFGKKDDEGNQIDIYMMPTKDGNIEVTSTKRIESEKKRGGLMGLMGKKDKNVQYKDTEREVIDISGKSDDEVVDAITKHVSKL